MKKPRRQTKPVEPVSTLHELVLKNCLARADEEGREWLRNIRAEWEES